MDDEAVYLVPIGSGRFELYTEPPEDVASGAARARDGFWSRTIHQWHERWRRIAHAAHVGGGAGASTGVLARGRDWMVRRVAESIAEQRTLWSLRGVQSAVFVYPSDLSDASAAGVRERLLANARQNHGRWLLLNSAGAAVSAPLMLLPGPNLIGYYFVFRVIGHYLSWRGACQAMERTSWRSRAEPALTELGALARLAAFFDRVALPPRS